MANDSGGADNGGNRSVLQNAVRYLGQIVTILGRSFPQVTGTASSATGGAATLPANPVKFVTIVLPDGSTALIPAYDP